MSNFDLAKKVYKNVVYKFFTIKINPNKAIK
uniref:Uncharacterized protein n=1 Tax=viral metagenome TaxID=1070528 RepID=A0A6C0F1B5_9ZZZZ